MATIKRRDVKGSPRFDVRFRDPAGKQRMKTFTRMTDARAFASTCEADKLRGTYIDIDAGRETFKQYASRWLDTRGYDAKTYDIRARHLRLHIYDVIGDVPLAKITASTILGLLKSFDVGDSYKADLYETTALILSAAVDDKLIGANPARERSVLNVKPTRPKRKVTPWPDKWISDLHDAMPERYRICITLGAGLGLRQGEMFGLAVEDVDFLRGVVRVRRQVREESCKRVYAPAKARKEAEYRDVPLPDSVRDELAAYMKRFPPQSVELPWKTADSERRVSARLIITTRNGCAIDKDSFNKTWAIMRERVKIPAGRENGTHALRHWYASSLLDAGVSIKVVSENLGHSDPGFTLRTYTHLMPSAEDKSRNAIDARFAKLNGDDEQQQSDESKASE